jgi:hypothetical protein
MSTEYDLGQLPADRQLDLPSQRSVDTAVTGPTVRVLPHRPRWQTRFARCIVADLVAVSVSALSYGFWGSAPAHSLVLPAVVVVVLTAACLFLARAWDPAVLGDGSVEFSRLLRGMLGSAVAIGLLSLALQLPEGRPWVFGVLPIAGIIAAFSRLALRRGLHRRRQDGRAMERVLAVGTHESVASLIGRTRRASHHGWETVGVCTPTGWWRCSSCCSSRRRC